MIEVIVKRLGKLDFETRLDVVPRAGEHIFVGDGRFEVVQVHHNFDNRPLIRIICGGDINANSTKEGQTDA